MGEEKTHCRGGFKDAVVQQARQVLCGGLRQGLSGDTDSVESMKMGADLHKNDRQWQAG